MSEEMREMIQDLVALAAGFGIDRIEILDAINTEFDTVAGV